MVRIPRPEAFPSSVNQKLSLDDPWHLYGTSFQTPSATHLLLAARSVVQEPPHAAEFLRAAPRVVGGFAVQRRVVGTGGRRVYPVYPVEIENG